MAKGKCHYCKCPAHNVRPFGRREIEIKRSQVPKWAHQGDDTDEVERWLATVDNFQRKAKKLIKAIHRAP